MSAESRLAAVLKHQAPVIAILAGFAAIPVFVDDSYVLGVWTFLLLNVIVVVGLDLMLGYAGQLSLGHGLFVAVGAYASGLLTTRLGWSGWAAMPAGMAAAAALAVIVAIPTLRLRGYYLAMATLGFPVVFDAMVRVTSSWSGGSSGVISIPRLKLGDYVLRDPVDYFYVVLIAAALVVLACWNIANSRIGLKLRAIHADDTAAAARGIDVVRLKIGVFAFSAAIAALSGSLYVHNVQFVAPDTFGLNYSLMAVILLVVGGMGRIWGGILGVVLLGWLPELMREAATWQPVIFGAILAAIMLFAPEGLAGLVRRRSFFTPTRLPPAGETTLPAAGPVLEVEDVSRAFGGVQAVRALNLNVRRGEIKAIIGPNGAGKSTALALISGALPCDRGAITLKGQRVETAPAHCRARLGLARTFQHARLIPSLTVYENILLGAAALGAGARRDERAASDVLRQLGLAGVADRFPGETNQYQRRLTEIGVALAADPALLMLDEPGAGLSAADLERLAALLRQQRAKGRGIVLIDHIMSLVVPLSDSILVLNSGETIIDDSPARVLDDSRVRHAYLGARRAAHA